MQKVRGPTITYLSESSVGAWARNIRMALKLSQEEVAAMAGVPTADVDAFENTIPVPLDSRRRIVKLLYAARNIR